MVTDGEGRLAFVNRDLLGVGGWTWPEIAGRRWHEALIPREHRDRARREFDAALEEGGASYVETPVLGGDGRVRSIAWSSSASLDDSGETVTVTSVGIDVTQWAEERERISALRLFEESHDVLTGLVNVATFGYQLGVALAGPRGTDPQIAVLLIGIDRFRAVIETLGHEAGDRLLHEVAGRVEACAQGHTVARWTNDEFAIMLTGVASQAEAEVVAQDVVDAMSLPCTSCSTEFHLGASVGIVLAPQDGDNTTTLMRHAATAMSHAKAAGGQRHAVFRASLSSAAKERILFEQQLHGAVARSEISLLFQPLVDAATHRILGVEALARWQHPILGSIPPTRFIPLAEETGMIISIGRYVLKNALVQAQRWRGAGFGDVTMAVNVSPHQLADGAFVADVRRILEETQTPSHLLEIEVTETAAMADVESVAEVLRQLSELGAIISLDDFGTGYSCLGKLNDLAVSTIKIDRSFIVASGSAAKPHALLRAMVALGHSLNLRVIAEGVETEEQLQRLGAEGVDAYQGFLFAPPLPAAEIARLIGGGGPLH